MKINKTLFTISLLLLSLSIFAQTGSIDIVKTKYPQIYTSIVESAEKQWGNDNKTKQTVIEGQAKAFLSIVESRETINGDVMTEAALNNSLPGMKDNNAKIINDLSIENPFPLLKCDWYKTKTAYDKNIAANGSQSQAPRRNISRTNNTPVVTSNSDNSNDLTVNLDEWVEENPSISEDTNTNMYEDDWETPYSSNNNIVSRNTTTTANELPFSLGLTLKTGLNTLLNVRDFSKYPGFAFEAGLSGIVRPDAGGVFFQNELVFSYSEAGISEKDSYYNYYTYDYDVFNTSLINTLYIGYSSNISSKARFLFGVGAFGQWKINSGIVDADKGIDFKYNRFNWGAAALLGFETKRFQFGIYPKLSLGNSELSVHYQGYEHRFLENSAKILTINAGVTFWFF